MERFVQKSGDSTSGTSLKSVMDIFLQILQNLRAQLSLKPSSRTHVVYE